MKTLEILFTNRRKEKVTAESVSLTEVPGWVILKSGGAVAEMIPASVIRRIRFLAARGEDTEANASAPAPAVASESPAHAAPPSIPDHFLKLPMRPSYAQVKRTPLVPSRRLA